MIGSDYKIMKLDGAGKLLALAESRDVLCSLLGYYKFAVIRRATTH